MIAKVAVRLAIGCWFKHASDTAEISRAESNAFADGRRGKARRKSGRAVLSPGLRWSHRADLVGALI
jgi:hypothetical protein